MAIDAFQTEVGDDEIEFEDEASIAGAVFQDGMVCLYGPPKIGKSNLASKIPGIYMLPTEPGYKWLKTRKTYIPSWAHFLAFIQKMKRNSKKVSEVTMWCIDTGDNLSKFAMQYACGREEIAHPEDHEWGKGWEAFRDEFNHGILELAALGPGILIIAHEKERDVVVRSRTVTKCTPSMPKTTYSLVNALADVTLHMSFDIGMIKKKTKRKGGRKVTPEMYACRCIYTKPTENRDAGDRSGLLPPKILFATEQEAVDKILGYFEGTVKKGGDKKIRRLRRNKRK